MFFSTDLINTIYRVKIVIICDKLYSTISRFIATKVSDEPVSSLAAVSYSSDPVRVILPFKDQSSADIVGRQLQDLSHKIHTTVSLVFES